VLSLIFEAKCLKTEDECCRTNCVVFYSSVLDFWILWNQMAAMIIFLFFLANMSPPTLSSPWKQKTVKVCCRLFLYFPLLKLMSNGVGLVSIALFILCFEPHN